MLHDDLTLYTNKEYRSSYYLEKCWSLIEEKILFFIGFIINPVFSIKLESDCIELCVMNKEKILYKKIITKNFSHSLNLCEDFTICIAIDPNSEKYTNRCNCVYSFVKESEDEGVISFECDYNLSIENYNEIKNKIISSLCFEAQYAINKNIFQYNIDKKNNKADLDSHYELVKFNSKINNIDFNLSLKNLIINNLVSSHSYNKLLMIEKKVEKYYV